MRYDPEQGIGRDDAQAAAREAIGEVALTDSVALALFTAARRYETAATQENHRPSKLRRILQELKKRAERLLAYPTSKRARDLLKAYAEKMPEEAWVRCGSLPDEPNSPLRSALEIEGKPDKTALTQKKNHTEMAERVLEIATEALETLPADPGGRPRDKAVQDLVNGLSLTYERYAERAAKLAYSEDEGGTNPFTRMVLKIACSVRPRIEPAKLIDYVREYRSYGEPDARAEYDETLADLVQLTDPRR